MIDVIRIVDVICVVMLLAVLLRQRRIMMRLESLESCDSGCMLENIKETRPPEVIESVH